MKTITITGESAGKISDKTQRIRRNCMVNRRSIALFGAIVMMMTLISCGPATSQYMVRKNAGELKAVDGNMCKIVFMRPGKYAEGAAPIILDSNGKYIGEGLSKTYFIVTLPAGKYTFIAWG